MATLDEMMQAMSGKPTAASRSREFDHQQFNPNVFGADALKEWLKGVKERTLHPLEALAKYSQDFQKMSPVDQGLQLTGGGLAGTFAGVGAKTANLAKLELAQKLKQAGEGNALSLPKTQKEPLFDTSGLPNRGRDLIQSKAEEYAQKMRDSGVNVIDVHHSGSAAGPSSYIKVQGYPDIRISGHSKGVWGTQNVVNVGSDSLFDEVLSKIPKTVRFGSPEEIAAILSKQKEEEIATMYPIRIKSAEKKLAKGKGLTYSEQEAMDWLKNQNIAPKTKYELAHELAQRNAALPVEQGGLGLLANNTAMERAKAMGFDTPAYHGTNADIRQADYAHSGGGADQYGSAALYTATDPTMASGYAKPLNIQEGGNVLPLLLNTKGYIAHDLEKKLTSPQIKKLIEKSPDEYALSNYGDVDYEGKSNVIRSAVNAYKDSGQDELLRQLHMINNDFYTGNPQKFNDTAGSVLGIRGVSADVGGGNKFLMPWKPEDIRSRFAAFDPLKRNSPDLLSSLLPITTTGLLANQLRQSLWAEPQPD